MKRPKHMRRIKFQYNDKWYTGTYIACKDCIIRINDSKLKRLWIKKIQQWEYIK